MINFKKIVLPAALVATAIGGYVAIDNVNKRRRWADSMGRINTWQAQLLAKFLRRDVSAMTAAPTDHAVQDLIRQTGVNKLIEQANSRPNSRQKPATTAPIVYEDYAKGDVFPGKAYGLNDVIGGLFNYRGMNSTNPADQVRFGLGRFFVKRVGNQLEVSDTYNFNGNSVTGATRSALNRVDRMVASLLQPILPDFGLRTYVSTLNDEAGYVLSFKLNLTAEQCAALDRAGITG